MDLVSMMIWSDITLFNNAVEALKELHIDKDEVALIDSDTSDEDDTGAIMPCIIPSSFQLAISFAKLELDHTEDLAFLNFRLKLCGFLASRLQIPRAEVMEKLRPEDVVSSFILVTQFLG